MSINPTETLQAFWMLCIVHALCDYPLQGDFMAKAKNPVQPIEGVPWQWPMFAHCMIHAGGVWLVTGSFLCACGEVFAHWVLDELKCRGIIGFTADQSGHLTCKALWALAGLR